MAGGEKCAPGAEIEKIESRIHPDRPPRVVVTDGAQIPRERSMFVAWWAAIIVTLILIPTLTILFPDSYRRILAFIPDGILRTIQITIISIGVALVIGLLAGLGRTSKNPVINGIASLYVEVIRGIPLLAQLFWIYYALSRIVVLGPYPSAIIGLAVCYGAYIGEIFRAGIQSIPKGQWEAARSLGMRAGQAMRHVILPQAIRVVLPPIGNEFIALLKDSSLVSVLAISDLLRRGREYASRTFQYFETYTMVAVVYLLMTLIFSRVVFYIERGMAVEAKEEGPPAFMQRLASYIVDAIVLYVIWMVIGGLFDLGLGLAGRFLSADSLAVVTSTVAVARPATFIVVALLYFLLFWVRSGQTPGKMAVGVRLIGPDDRHPTLERALLRLVPFVITLGPLVAWGIIWGVPLSQEALASADAWAAIPWWSYLLFLFPLGGFIGYLTCQWDRYGQGWHDKLAGTYVVRAT